MIRSVYYPSRGEPSFQLPVPEIQSALADPDGILWISLEQPSIDETNTILGDVFGFHPLTIEDCQNTEYQAAKLDDFEDYIFLITHAVQTETESSHIKTTELNIFLGHNFLVSYHNTPTMSVIEKVWRRLPRDARLHSYGVDFLCHALLDTLVDEYMPLVDQMDEEIEILEDQVMEKPNPTTLEHILRLKHSIMSMRRIIGPQRELLNRLSRDPYPMIDEQARIYFRDIYDHLVRVQDLSESVRDIVSGALDIYLNSTSLRLNEVMKALTVVSTIFLPLSFLAGVYGMNFEHMPELSWIFGYPMVWGLFISAAATMLIIFKKRGWF